MMAVGSGAVAPGGASLVSGAVKIVSAAASVSAVLSRWQVAGRPLPWVGHGRRSKKEGGSASLMLSVVFQLVQYEVREYAPARRQRHTRTRVFWISQANYTLR